MTDFYEYIEEYLNGNISAENKVLFESAMSKDENLKLAVANHSIAAEALDLLIEEDIRQVISSIDDSENEDPTKTPGYKTFLIGFLIATTLGLAAYLYNQLTTPDSEELYAMYYSEYMEQDVRTADLDNPISPCNQGHLFMQEGKFSEAKELFLETIQSENDCTDKAQWYLSLIYLKEEDFTELESILNIIVADEQSLYKTRASELTSKL